MINLECHHEPGFWDKLKWHVHSVWDHTPDFWDDDDAPNWVNHLCLNAMWVELGTECPTCIYAYDKMRMANYE